MTTPCIDIDMTRSNGDFVTALDPSTGEWLLATIAGYTDDGYNVVYWGHKGVYSVRWHEVVDPPPLVGGVPPMSDEEKKAADTRRMPPPPPRPPQQALQEEDMPPLEEVPLDERDDLFWI